MNSTHENASEESTREADRGKHEVESQEERTESKEMVWGSRTDKHGITEMSYGRKFGGMNGDEDGGGHEVGILETMAVYKSPSVDSEQDLKCVGFRNRVSMANERITKEKERQGKSEQKSDAMLEQKSDEMLEQKSDEMLEQKSDEMLEQKSDEMLEQKSDEMLEQKSDEMLEQKSDEMLEQKSDEMLEQKSDEMLEQKSEEMLEQKGDEILEQKGDEILEQKGDEILEQKSDEMLEQKDDEILEQKGDEIVEQKSDEILEQKGDEILEQKGDEILEQKGDEILEQKGDEIPEQKSDEILEHNNEDNRGITVSATSLETGYSSAASTNDLHQNVPTMLYLERSVMLETRINGLHDGDLDADNENDSDTSQEVIDDPAGADELLELTFNTCCVCFLVAVSVPLSCCGQHVCQECLKLYCDSQMDLARWKMRCPVPECDKRIKDTTLEAILSSEQLVRLQEVWKLRRTSTTSRPCPRCGHRTSPPNHKNTAKNGARKRKVECLQCKLPWCFSCHAPWHEGVSCRAYRRGDKMLRRWACQTNISGQRNAQMCPSCKIHIEKTEGCNHIICSQCSAEFCYRCGERYRHLRFFGDHNTKRSVFGCKFIYYADRPVLRRLLRGSICGAKIFFAPLLLILLLVALVLIILLGIIAGPLYLVYGIRHHDHRPREMYV
uniref:E3 ubiquitin-protein ligase RNF217 isoform X2 n=1 Tax=Myxine glutinosa TaxID=7769 RepID=UPI00358E7570